MLLGYYVYYIDTEEHLAMHPELFGSKEEARAWGRSSEHDTYLVHRWDLKGEAPAVPAGA